MKAIVSCDQVVIFDMSTMFPYRFYWKSANLSYGKPADQQPPLLIAVAINITDGVQKLSKIHPQIVGL